VTSTDNEESSSVDSQKKSSLQRNAAGTIPTPTNVSGLHISRRECKAHITPTSEAQQSGFDQSGDAAQLRDKIHEAYAFGGIGLILEAATDNKNSAAADLRRIPLGIYGHSASEGNVSYPFPSKRRIAISAEASIDAASLKLVPGADAADVNRDVEYDVLLTAHDQLHSTSEALGSAGVELDSIKTTFIPDSLVHVADDDVATQVIQLCEALEDIEDVQHVYANFEPSEAVLAKHSG
jgi:transcriptional/translational regulatory protein YebC/TACO1